MASYNILSLDGGGTWAFIQVNALIGIYGPEARGRTILRNFDLAAANSGGAVVLAGLICNLALKEIKALFLSEADRKQIFAPTSFFRWSTLARIFGIGPRFSTAAKRAKLARTFGDAGAKPLHTLADEIAAENGKRTDFLIVAFDYDRNRAMFFRSNLASRAASGAPPFAASLVDAVAASCNAPVNYFDEPAAVDGTAGGQRQTRRFWDGGLTGLNNPVLAAAIEALANAPADSHIRALSIGTGTVALPVSDDGDDRLVKRPVEPSLLRDIEKVATAILDDPPDVATFDAHMLLRQPLPAPGGQVGDGAVVRMNPLVQPILADGAWTVPDGLSEKELVDLSEMDFAVTDQESIDLIERFCTLWIDGSRPPASRRRCVRNQAVRARADTQTVEIGHATYPEALEAWRRLAADPPAPAIA